MIAVQLAENLLPGDHVIADDTTHGRVEGVAYLDDEGGLRVGDVPLYTDAEGYLLPGVTLVSATRPFNDEGVRVIADIVLDTLADIRAALSPEAFAAVLAECSREVTA